MASHIFDTRTDIIVLKKAELELGKQFQRIRDCFDLLEDHNLCSIDKHDDLAAQAHLRHLLIIELIETLATIRDRRDFRNFLHDSSESALKELVVERFIIVVNISHIRNDAIVITKNKISALSLPNLQHDILRLKVEIFSNSCYSLNLIKEVLR